MAVPCCCGPTDVCGVCPDGGTLPDAFLLVLTGFAPWFFEYDGTWPCYKVASVGGIGYWRTVKEWGPPGFTTPVFINCPTIVYTPGGLVVGAPFEIATSRLNTFGSSSGVGWGNVPPWFIYGPAAVTVACNPPDVRCPPGSFGGSPALGFNIALPLARANIVAL